MSWAEWLMAVNATAADRIVCVSMYLSVCHLWPLLSVVPPCEREDAPPPHTHTGNIVATGACTLNNLMSVVRSQAVWCFFLIYCPLNYFVLFPSADFYHALFYPIRFDSDPSMWILYLSVLFCHVTFCSFWLYSVFYICSDQFCSVLPCSHLFSSLPVHCFYSILFCSILFCSVLFCFCCVLSMPMLIMFLLLL